MRKCTKIVKIRRLVCVTNILKKLPKKTWIVIGVVFAILVVIICLLCGMKTTVNLDNYLVIRTDGYDGYGTAYATLDWDAIEAKYGKKIFYYTKDKLG